MMLISYRTLLYDDITLVNKRSFLSRETSISKFLKLYIVKDVKLTLLNHSIFRKRRRNKWRSDQVYGGSQSSRS